MKTIEFSKLFLNRVTFYISVIISLIIHLYIINDSPETDKIEIHNNMTKNSYDYVSYTFNNNYSEDKNNSNNRNKDYSGKRKTNGKEQSSKSFSKEIKERVIKTYEQSLLKKIHRNKYYPLYAKEMNMEGEVKLSFVLLKNGSLNGDVKILKKCDHGLLNKSGIKTIRISAPFLPFPKEINLKKKTFIVTIKYSQRFL